MLPRCPSSRPHDRAAAVAVSWFSEEKREEPFLIAKALQTGSPHTLLVAKPFAIHCQAQPVVRLQQGSDVFVRTPCVPLIHICRLDSRSRLIELSHELLEIARRDRFVSPDVDSGNPCDSLAAAEPHKGQRRSEAHSAEEPLGLEEVHLGEERKILGRSGAPITEDSEDDFQTWSSVLECLKSRERLRSNSFFSRCPDVSGELFPSRRLLNQDLATSASLEEKVADRRRATFALAMDQRARGMHEVGDLNIGLPGEPDEGPIEQSQTRLRRGGG